MAPVPSRDVGSPPGKKVGCKPQGKPHVMYTYVVGEGEPPPSPPPLPPARALLRHGVLSREHEGHEQPQNQGVRPARANAKALPLYRSHKAETGATDATRAES